MIAGGLISWGREEEVGERGIVEKALRRGEIFFIGIWIVRSDLVSRIWL